MAAPNMIHRQPIRGWRPSEYGSRNQGCRRMTPQAGSELSAEGSRAIEREIKDVFETADPLTKQWLRILTI